VEQRSVADHPWPLGCGRIGQHRCLRIDADRPTTRFIHGFRILVEQQKVACTDPAGIGYASHCRPGVGILEQPVHKREISNPVFCEVAIFGQVKLEIGRIVLLVKDFEASLVFYRDAVGLELADEPQVNWATFVTGAAILSIAGPFAGMPYDPKSLGETPDQLMFVVDDITAAANDLRSRGVSVGEPFSPGEGVLLAEFRDPDGRFLALEQK